MALSTSPRKVVPLATGDESRPRSVLSTSVTKRVFFCGIVIEGSENGRRLPDDIQDLVLSFGNTVSMNLPGSMISSNSTNTLAGLDRARQRTDISALISVIDELVTSERSYVNRLQILKNDYADPLRSFAKSKDTQIIPAYEAKTLFGNVDNLLPVNEAFLADLEMMLSPNGSRTVGGVGDVALKHFKDLRGFELYRQYYVKREDAQLIFEREISKRSSRFAAYIDRIKYQSTDSKNRVGLRELLMEPVQRIPRYTLLFRTMLKHMAMDDPQRPKIIEADEIASKIAHAEADEQTKRAAIFYCLTATVEAFPPDLFSNSRKFIDCLDVEDVLMDAPAPSSSTSGSSAMSLHCTLFLFDDKLVIVKRPSNGEKGGRALSGLDELDKVTKAGGIPGGKKKSGMTCKGVVDITDVVATDVGGAEINLYLENPPTDQTDRWSGRPFRSLVVVHPPTPANLDPIRAESDKARFLEKLWHAQATYRARAGQSVVLCAEEQEVEAKAGRITIARTYYNVYQRTAFLQEPKKTKIVVHIDPMGSADPLPFGMGGAPPFARIRVQPLAGGLCRYAVTSNDPADESEEDIVQTERVPSRVVQTIHQFGLFQFRTGKNSAPSTPTARSKAAIFGLDAISRNLFNSRPGSSMGDFFGGSISGHRRTKSTISRSSVYTQSTNTGDGSLTKFSHRSNSTAATTVSGDEDSLFTPKISRTRKLLKRGKSPGGSDSERGSPIRSLSRSVSRARSPSTERDSGLSDREVDDLGLGNRTNTDSSEWELAMQLELARKNSLNQHSKPLPLLDVAIPTHSAIPEESQFLRPESRLSGDTHSQHSTIGRPESTTPTRELDSPPRHSRSLSQQPSDTRRFGPRSPSPLPPSRSPNNRASTIELPSTDGESMREAPRTRPLPAPSNQPVSAIPRSKRQTQLANSIPDTTPKSAPPPPQSTPAIEPLSIKKKTSVRSSSSHTSPTPVRKTFARNSPLNRSNKISPRRVSPQVRKVKTPTSKLSVLNSENMEHLMQLFQTTKDDIDSSRRAVKRIKLEVDEFSSNSQPSEEPYSRPSSPDKSFHTPQKSSAAMTKAAQDRMEEMRQLISKRAGETPRARALGIFDTPTRRSNACNVDEFKRSADTLISEAENALVQASSSHEELQGELSRLAADFKERTMELERARQELQSNRRQTELVKSLLNDVTSEKEIMYEAFNEELDSMFNDVNLPDDEAWTAMSIDLRRTKELRNNLRLENSALKRSLAEAELQRDEWASILRAHNLIP